MLRDLFFIIGGYLLGSILFARVFGMLLCSKDITQGTPDENPGVANAFIMGGFLCGTLTLICELGKGFLPVFLYLRGGGPHEALTFVMFAPVLGHILPVFFRFRGGKGIAATFGSLLGLFPNFFPFAVLALFFIFFSIALIISPNYYRTLAAYICAEAVMLVLSRDPSVLIGFSLITVSVTVRMLASREKKEPIKVGLIWKH